MHPDFESNLITHMHPDFESNLITQLEVSQITGSDVIFAFVKGT